jgi:hypothetical protein
VTEGITSRATALGFDKSLGLAGAASILEDEAAGTVVDRSMHAVGKVCPRCGRTFTGDDPVRRTTSGDFVHDVC